MFSSLKSVATALTASLIIGNCFSFIKPAHANLFLTPMYLKMESKQGQSQGVLQVGNTSSIPIRVRLYATAFTYNKNGEFQRLDRSPDNDLTPYIRYSPREMIIPANSSRRVRLISLLPPSLPEGEYRTAIFAETLQAKTNSQGYKVGLNLSIDSALYVVKGEISPEINVIETYLNQEGKQLQILVANDGTATAKGEITWTLKQGGSEIASGISGGSFLPKSRSNILLNRDKSQKLDLAPGTYQLEGEIVWNNSDNKEKTSFAFDIEL